MSLSVTHETLPQRVVFASREAARHEFIVLSDVLGASMQTVTVNNQAYGDATEATVFGPFFVEGSPEIPLAATSPAGRRGQPCWVEGTVTDAAGKSVPNAPIEVWEAGDLGFYDVRYSDARVAARGRLHTDAEGDYRFWAITPTPYPIPSDGPVGRLRAATNRSPLGASPPGRVGTPSDVAAAFASLLGNGFITGAVRPVANQSSHTANVQSQVKSA